MRAAAQHAAQPGRAEQQGSAEAVGKVVARDEDSYRYLVESIRRFPSPDRFRAMIAEAGFVQAKAEPMLGGLVCIWSGWKV